MRTAHLLRKYNPREWGGTESAVKRLCDGLRGCSVESVLFCPKAEGIGRVADPFADSGYELRRYHAFLPVWGLSREQRESLVYVGGNLMSFDLFWSLWREPGLSVIHTHAQNRIAAIGLAVARRRHLPLVVSIHGGVLDLPEAVRESLRAPMRGGFEWGKIFGAFLGSRQVLARADAILTCNQREAGLLHQKYPDQRIVVQPHGVCAAEFRVDHREAARGAFPCIVGKQMLLVAGRIDPVKNQRWVIEQAPDILNRFPNAILVLAGSVGEHSCVDAIRARLCVDGLENRVLLTGGLPPGDPRLIGLFQEAQALLLPSLSETFGLVILEAWAAGTPVIASRTSGALELIQPGENGWLFDLDAPAGFHRAVCEALALPQESRRMGAAGRDLVRKKYDSAILAREVASLYQQLSEEKS